MAYKDQVLRDGPIGFFRFSEVSGTPQSEVGTVSIGAIEGVPDLTEPGYDGSTDGAVYLGGGDWYTLDKTLGDLGIGDAQPRSVACWAKTSTFDNDGVVFSFGSGGNDTNGSFALKVTGTDNEWKLEVWGDAITSTVTGSFGKWTFFAATYDGTTLSLYANGALVGTLSVTLTSTTSRNPQIGTTDYKTTGFTGSIDELAVFDYALTAEQVRRHYWAGKGKTENLLAALTAGAVAYYPLNETSGTTAQDSVGGNTGSYQGVVTLDVAGIPGGEGSAVHVDSQAYVDIPNASEIAFGASQSFTAMGWFKPDSTMNWSQSWCLASHERGTNGWAWVVEPGDTGIRFLTNNGNIQTSGLSNLPGGEWTHLASVYDGNTGTVTWYVNGVENVSGNPNYQGASGQPLALGLRPHSTANDYVGAIDEFVLCDRVLTADEIARTYHRGLGQSGYALEVLAAVPSAYWTLSEQSGTAAIDEAGGNSGTYTSVALDQPGLTYEGRSVRLDGSSSQLQVPAGICNGIGSSDFAIEMWVDVRGTGSRLTLLGHGEAGQPGTLFLQWRDSTDLNFYWYDSNGDATDLKTTTAPVSINAVHHLLAQRRGGQLEIFVDGALVASGAVINNGNLPSSGANTFIGCRCDDPNPRKVDGFFQHVAIYYRALNSSEIVRHYYFGLLGPIAAKILYLAGTVTNEADGSPLEAAIKALRWDTAELIAETTSDPADGTYRVEGFDYDGELLVVMQPQGLETGIRPLAHGPVLPAVDES